MQNILYIELNNWAPGVDYPNCEPFISWIDNFKFRDNNWIKDNKLVVVETIIDMSNNFLITVPKEWIKTICPDFLIKYAQFLRFPNKNGEVYGRLSGPFLPYTQENIGYHFVEESNN